MADKPNYNRMLSLIDEVFATRSDPGQIQVTQAQMKKLQDIHPATLSEIADEKGPLVWVLVIPTTKNIMNDFVEGKIGENELLERTKPGDTYTCLYLCSATTLPEYRSKGHTKQLCMQAIANISSDHPIDTLFVWPFTAEGDALAAAVAKSCGLRLEKKN